MPFLKDQFVIDSENVIHVLENSAQLCTKQTENASQINKYLKPQINKSWLLQMN